MNRITKVLLATTLLINASIASAAFVTTNTRGGDGFVTGSYPNFTITGSDNGDLSSTDDAVDSRNHYLTTYTDTFLSNTIVNFEWSYRTEDVNGSFLDQGGYVLNNVFTRLSPNNLALFGSASGAAMVSVLSGDVFGFYIRSLDGILGRAYLDIDAELSPSAVPVPPALPLMASALGIFGIARRRNKSKAT